MNAKMLTVEEISRMLEADPKKVRRYISQGKLKAQKQKINKAEFRYIVKNNDLEHFVFRQKSYEKLLPHIKEMFMLKLCGLSENVIASEFSGYNRISGFGHISEDEVFSAIDEYMKFRRTRLNYCGIREKDHKKVLIPSEACARLSIKDIHVVHHLVGYGDLERVAVSRDLCPFGQNLFISVDSMKRYLGADLKERFYTSKDASNITSKSVNSIDRIALYNELGRKIKKNSKNSIYLFTYDEVVQLGNLPAPNGWDMSKARKNFYKSG